MFRRSSRTTSRLVQAHSPASPRTPRSSLRPLVLAIELAVAATPVAAWSQDGAALHADAGQARSYSVAAGPLAAALNQFAEQAGVLLAASGELAAGRSSAGLRGSYRVREGFAALLAGSGLEAVRHADGSYGVRRLAAPADTRMLPAVIVTAQAERDATTEGSGSYAAQRATLMKGARTLRDIPQTVSVVTRQLMDDRNVESIYEALTSSPGIIIQQSPQGGQYIYSRGFELGTVQYDGIPLTRNLYGRASNYSSAMAYIDRVEVLRGAAGLMQGEGSPSGAANLVRMRPTGASAVSVKAQGGSWDRKGAQVDADGVLNEEGTLRGRALVDYQDQHSFVDLVDSRNATLYATLEYDLSPRTTVNIGASFEEVKGRPFLNGLPHYSTGADLGLPRSTFLGATWNRQRSSNRGWYADLSHRFDNRWKLKVAGVHMAESHDFKFAGVNGAVNPATMRSANIVSRQLADVEATGIDANLTGAFAAWGRQHELVIGANHARSTVDHAFAYKLNYNVFDIRSYDPALREPDDAEIYAANREYTKARTSQHGLYSALRLQLADPLKLVLGARLSWFDNDWASLTAAGAWRPTSSKREDGKTTPYAGLIYELGPHWSAYASYADVFQTQTQRNEAGDVLRPIVGANYEAGIKGSIANGQVNAALALFRIDQNHRAQVDYATSPICRNNYYCYSDAGEVRSEGLDAELSGRLAPDWNLMAGYTFTRTRYIEDASSRGAVFSPDTPKHLARIWTTYRLPGALKAFTVGGGVDAQSATYRQVGALRADIGGRAVWSALLRVDIDRRWNASLNLNNVFDKRYYRALAGFNNGSYYGDPRNLMLTLRGAF